MHVVTKWNILYELESGKKVAFDFSENHIQNLIRSIANITFDEPII